jgi:hypothetical protein
VTELRPTPTQPTAPPTIELDPDGRQIVVVDVAGEPLDGVVWGAVRAGRMIALICTEPDPATRQTDPPVAAEFRALADALDDDPHNPHLHPGSRAWEREGRKNAERTIDRLRARLDAETARADAAETARDSFHRKRDVARNHAVRNDTERDTLQAALEETQELLNEAHGQIDALRAELTAAREPADPGHDTEHDAGWQTWIDTESIRGDRRPSLFARLFRGDR